MRYPRFENIELDENEKWEVEAMLRGMCEDDAYDLKRDYRGDIYAARFDRMYNT